MSCCVITSARINNRLQVQEVFNAYIALKNSPKADIWYIDFYKAQEELYNYLLRGYVLYSFLKYNSISKHCNISIYSAAAKSI